MNELSLKLVDTCKMQLIFPFLKLTTSVLLDVLQVYKIRNEKYEVKVWNDSYTMRFNFHLFITFISYILQLIRIIHVPQSDTV